MDSYFTGDVSGVVRGSCAAVGEAVTTFVEVLKEA
jgi:hypothetical protein